MEGIETSKQNKHVCVIGAGASGMISIYELIKQGHKVDCFESESQVGGTWAYGKSRRSSMY